ncbi:ribosome hibernation promoting factor HPF [Kordia sp. SMS9]|uniref:ribosome hibernation-promoting factor, HPF/YfiA family n=1 Tax=Kordia sp. SMS9 TaxID=2282170 RepID=UPI000E0D7A5C|nr:ribosome-associated translation inhibitor RaiA [Kordia sp. SMS9]AXG70756.1 ribosome hibernation promoting factor HPF [Kordia sp. SMS9]
MKINIQFIHMDTSEAMEAYTTEKLNRLAKKYDMIIHTDVFFKSEKDPKGKGNICEMEVSMVGPRIFASSNEENYEVAVKNTIKDLEKQLEKRKKTLKPYL